MNVKRLLFAALAVFASVQILEFVLNLLREPTRGLLFAACRGGDFN